MSYVKRTLGDGEVIKAKANLHWINYIALWGAMGIVLIFGTYGIAENEDTCTGIALVLLVIILYYFLKLNAIEMVVTNKRVVCRKGIIGIKTWELKNNKIESVEVKQSILGRILGYATFWFSGTGTSKVCFHDVKNPWALKKKIDLIIETGEH